MNSILDDFKRAFRTGNILNQIIVVNVVGFAVLGILGVFLTLSGYEEVYDRLARHLMLPANLNELILQPWAIITYFFYHQGIFHILWNMLFLYWFGKIIVDYLGQHKVLGLYVWGGIGGGLLYLLIYNALPYFSSAVPVSYLLGASGGVIAIVVGAATYLPNFAVHLIFLGPVKLKYIALFFVLASLIQSTGNNAGGEIAHLGGAVVGYFFIVQLRQGNDWSRYVVRFIAWVRSFFIKQPNIKVSYKSEKRSGKRPARSRPPGPGESATASQTEIDAILDKISEKGYDALTKEEKQKLFNASKD